MTNKRTAVDVVKYNSIPCRLDHLTIIAITFNDIWWEDHNEYDEQGNIVYCLFSRHTIKAQEMAEFASVKITNDLKRVMTEHKRMGNV